jgi:OOP family OmpA-OmpF porin
MKKPILLITAILFFSAANAQFGLLDRAKQKTKDKLNQKIDQKMDKAIGDGVDSVDNGISGKNRKNKNQANTNTISTDNDAVTNNAGSNTIVVTPSLKSYSKFDFVPGEKMVAAEDFSQDAVGDFPVKWNTNGSGEIVTINKAPGKFLLTQKFVVFYPEWIKNLPDNFTLEFDLVSTDKYSYYSGFFNVGFTTETNVGKNFNKFNQFENGRVEKGGGFEVAFHPQGASGNLGITHFYSSNNSTDIIKNDNGQDKFLTETNKTLVHISIWRQRSRVRVYMDDKKVWDLPKAVADGAQLNAVYFRNDGAENDNDSYSWAICAWPLVLPIPAIN